MEFLNVYINIVIDKDNLFWFFSAVAQSLAALIGIVGVFGVFRLQIGYQELEKRKDRFTELLNAHERDARLQYLPLNELFERYDALIVSLNGHIKQRDESTSKAQEDKKKNPNHREEYERQIKENENYNAMKSGQITLLTNKRKDVDSALDFIDRFIKSVKNCFAHLIFLFLFSLCFLFHSVLLAKFSDSIILIVIFVCFLARAIYKLGLLCRTSLEFDLKKA